MRPNKFIAVISAAIISAGPGPAVAQEMQTGIFQIAAGASQKIDRHGVCRVVQNGGTNPIMVPTGSKEQWPDGTGPFLRNIENMPDVSVKDCVLWWEKRSGVLSAEFSSYHGSVYKFRGGVTRMTINGGLPRYGMQPGPLPKATYYNADTGACAPANSYIGTGPVFYQFMHNDWIFFAHVQLCDSDMIATAPFLQIKVFGQSELQDMPLPSFDRR